MKNLDRRHFLGGMVAAGAAPVLFNGCATGFCANRKVNVAVIGCGRISNSFEIPCVLRRGDIARIVAVCDLDTKRTAYSAAMVKKAYGPGAVVREYHDYKEVCACSDVDAVMICLPDFWHALVATTAICSGKAVWLQKPFTQTILEGRVIANLARKYNTVLQVGSQQRSWNQFEAVCRAVREGVIGEVRRVEVGIGLDVAGGSSERQPVPSNFDYETWLGPTDPTAPYNETRCHSQDTAKISSRPGWIQLAPYGWGMITNWGAHHIDIMQWGLGKDLEGPDSVEGTCEWMDLTGGKLWNVHTTYDLHYSYNGGKTDGHVCNKYQNGVKFIGEKGDWLFCTRGAVKVTDSDPDVPVKPGQLPPMAASRPELMPKPRAMACDATQLHVSNWLEAVQASDPSLTTTKAEIGHRSTSACSLGQMCMELGRGKKSAKVDWDWRKETTGCPTADAMMKPFARDKYDLRVNLREFGLDYDTVLRG